MDISLPFNHRLREDRYERTKDWYQGKADKEVWVTPRENPSVNELCERTLMWENPSVIETPREKYTIPKRELNEGPESENEGKAWMICSLIGARLWVDISLPLMQESLSERITFIGEALVLDSQVALETERQETKTQTRSADTKTWSKREKNHK